MENDANYALVGVISTAIIVALFGFIYWFAGPASNVATKQYNVIFTGTVTGITNGTDVLFNGIKIGQVTEITLDPNNTNRVIARIEVTENIPVKTDTRVLLSVQGLTGIGSIQLSGGTKEAGEPVPPPGETIPVLYAEKSDFQSILDGLTTTISGAADTVEQLNKFLAQNDTKLSASIDNIQTFSSALAANSDGMESFLSSLAQAGKEIGPMAGEIKTLSADVRALVAAVPPEQVTKVMSNVTTFSDSLANSSGKIDEVFASASSAAKTLNDVAEGLKPTVATIERVTTQIDAVTKTIDPQAVGRVVSNMDTFSTTLANNNENFNTIVASVNDLSKSLNASATRIEGILDRNEGQIDTFVASASGAAKNINDVAEGLKPSIVALDQVTKQIDPQTVGRVMANVDKFSTTLGENTDDINTIVANVTELSKSLNASAARIDGILTRVNGVVAGANDQGMFAEITEAAKSVRALADQLNSSTSQIASGLNNFTSQGLSQYSALAIEARNTLSRLDKVVRNLEQNPQSLVFGGDTVREYNKR